MEPRPAATLVVARPAANGIEVLALRRSGGTSRVPAPVPAELLPEIARWIAPEFLETRFDALHVEQVPNPRAPR